MKNFVYKEIKSCIKELGTLELWDLENTILKEFEKRTKKIKCLKCKKRKPIEYEEIGKGKFCQKCLDEENKIWLLKK